MTAKGESRVREDAMTRRPSIDERVRDEIVFAGSRGSTCHEIAEELGLSPRTVGRALARISDLLDHHRNTRWGQRVFTLRVSR